MNLSENLVNNNLELRIDESKVSDLKVRLKQDPEVLQLVKTINYKDQLQLMQVGEGSANEISKFADRILDTMKVTNMEGSTMMIKELSKIMERFDPKEIKEDPGFFKKMFTSAEKLIQKMFDKYTTMGQEIEKVYIEIKKYEMEMTQSVQTFEQMSEQNFRHYMALEKQIAALEIKAEELKTQTIPQLEAKANSGDDVARMELQAARNGLDLIEQLITSRLTAGHVAIQNEPNIRQLQRGNTSLIVRIKDAFITTLPAFKMGIINAVQARRQKLVNDSMKEFDRRANELLVRNAQNIADQGRDLANTAGTSGIRVETLEQTWQIIMQGIQDVDAIYKQNAQNQAAGQQKLAQLKEQYQQQIKTVS